MAIKIGSNNIANVLAGSNQVDKIYLGSQLMWQNFVAIVATGGTITTSGNYKIHTFTSSSNLVVTSGYDEVEYVIVGGGGGGGFYTGGGGGGGANMEGNGYAGGNGGSGIVIVRYRINP